MAMHEIDQLPNAAHPPPRVQVLPMPVVRGTPLSEYGSNIAINVFPTPFPTGRGGFDKQKQHNVSEEDWANCFLQLLGGKFAKHPQFRYWELNTFCEMRQRRLHSGTKVFDRASTPLQRHR
jgi:hypothetical protein